MNNYTPQLKVLLIVLITSLITGCGRVQVGEDVSPEELWMKANQNFEREKYLNATDVLTIFTMNHSGSTLIDSAQFLLAECHFALNEFIVAESEYSRLVQNFPQSPLVDDAWVKIILCNLYLSPRYDLDQKYTERTVLAIDDFLDQYSGSDISLRLAAKPKTWQSIRSVLTLGIWKTKRERVDRVSLYRTKVVYPHRTLGFGKWMLRLFTLGIYNPPEPALKIPYSSQVNGDWLVHKALEESRGRLAKKNFKTGELYYRLKKYPSAIIYFNTVLDYYDKSKWAEPSLLLKGHSYYTMHKYQEAAGAYERYINEFNGSDNSLAKARLKYCQQFLQGASATHPDSTASSNP